MSSEILIENPKNIFLQLLALMACILGGLFVGQFFSLSFLLLVYGFDVNKVQGLLLQYPFNAEGRFVLLSLQAITSFSMFILAPCFYLSVGEQKKLRSLNTNNRFSWILLLIAIVLPLVAMPLTASLASLNEAIKMPLFLADTETWMMQKEQELKKITIFLTDFQSFGGFLAGILVIAVIPALGEELVFRGFLQKKLTNKINPHIAIGLSAFIFSAIHIQFYGLFPRMFLGILLGYLYFWSGNLWYAILAHFINNAFTLLLMYLYKLQLIKIDVQNTPQVSIYAVFTSIILVGFLLKIYQGDAKKSTP